MRILEAVGKYLQHLKRERQFSEHTITVARQCLRFFLHFCNMHKLVEVTEVTIREIGLFTNYLYHYKKTNGESLSLSTRKTRTARVRVFFKWLTKRNYLLYNPAADLELPKEGRRLPRYVLTIGEARKILSLPNTARDCGKRDKAILELFYSTGIRKQELLNLKVNDVDFSRGTLTVRRGKGGYDRIVPLGDHAERWLTVYLEDVRAQWLSNKSVENIFLQEDGKTLMGDRLGHLVSDYVQKAKIDKRGSCHIFRHSMATHMIANGAGISFVQQMLGHRNIDNTKTYTHVAIADLRAVHRDTHPSNRYPLAKKNATSFIERDHHMSRGEAPTLKNKKKKAYSKLFLLPEVKQYFEHLQTRSMSERTINNQKYDLNIFFEWLTKNKIEKLTDITTAILQEYQGFVSEMKNRFDKPLAVKSKLNLLSSLKSLFSYLSKFEFLLFNPAGALELPKEPKQLPVNVLTVPEIEKILIQPNFKNYNGKRDKAILELLCATGMRRKELNDLCIKDIDFESETVFIKEGKGGHDRYLPLNHRSLFWLKKYLKVRPRCEAEKDCLFLTDYGTKIQGAWLGYLVHNYVKKADIGKQGGFLLFRHSVATLMIDYGASIRAVQKLLGHKNLSTTQIYIHVSVGKLKEVHKKTHPLEKDS